jgi:excisionase family DNA binding protein
MVTLQQAFPQVPRISLTPKEAAFSTGCSRTRIFEAIRNGKLVARGDGKSTIIEFEELTRWVRSLPTKGGGAIHSPVLQPSGMEACT